MFDTLGTLIGVASKANMLDKDGKLPKIKGALLSDAVGTTVGAMCGTSTVTTFVESASGVAEGGRTGLTSLVSAILFALSLFLSPIFLAIPSFATAPALIVVGFLMLTSVTKIDFDDLTEAIPAFIAIIAMPFLYSISEGIALGVISLTNYYKRLFSPFMMHPKPTDKIPVDEFNQNCSKSSGSSSTEYQYWNFNRTVFMH